MKKLIVLILCLTACRTADAQSVRFFATADDYLNGRFDTLPRSSLKIRQLFVSINKTGLSDNELRDKLKTNELHLLVFEDSLYANLSTTSIGKPSNRFRRVERFGDRIFFWTWPANHMLYVGIEGGIGGVFFGGFLASMMASGLAKPYCCYWNLQTGEFRLLDSGCLYDLLEKYPDLYENYLAEPKPNKRGTREDYFIEYLEREKPELLKSVPRKTGSGYNSRNHANDRTGAETKTKRTTTGSGQRMKTK